MIDNESCVRKSLQCMLRTLCLNGCTCVYMCMYMCTCCLPQADSQLEADEVVTDFRHSTMSKEYTVFALSLYLTLHIMCAYLNYWNHPFASTRYSVTHEVCIFWSLEPLFCLHLQCYMWGVYLGHWNHLSASTRYSVAHRVRILVHWSHFSASIRYSATSTNEVHILVHWNHFSASTRYSVTRTHEVHLGHWNHPLATTRYSVTHEVHILVNGAIFH